MTELDGSAEAHEWYARNIIAAVLGIDELASIERPVSFYTQWIVVAESGQPRSVWRWNADCGGLVEVPETDLLQELLSFQSTEKGQDAPVTKERATSSRTIYAQALGRDFALCIDEVLDGDLVAVGYVASAACADDHLFDIAVAGSEHSHLLLDRIEFLAAEAIARMKRWEQTTTPGPRPLDWPTSTDDWEQTPGPIPEGRLRMWAEIPETF